MANWLPVAEYREIVEHAFDREFGPNGFECIRRKGRWAKWVRSGKPHIHDVVQVYSFSPLCAATAWGLSLDFVPHLDSGDEVRWHRTPKSARMDFFEDPLDYTRDVHSWQVSRNDGRVEIQRQASALAKKAHEAALKLFSTVQTLEDVLQTFETFRKRPYVRFGFRNYPYLMLAYAFTLAASGKKKEAHKWFSEFEEAYRPRPETSRELLQLLGTARQR